MSEPQTITVDDYADGTRLDKFLSSALDGVSRARCQQLIDDGAVTKNGTPVTNASSKVRKGETYALIVPEVKPLNLTPEAITLNIVYEDDALLVIDKPAGMTVHPAPGAYTGTLVHALLAHCGDSLSGIGGVARPGIVHRIDKDTSGLLVVAKHDTAHQHLSAQLKDRTLKRTYLAYTWNALNPRTGEIDAPLARNPRNRKQMAVVDGGKEALTHYDTDAIYIPRGVITPVASKITCQLETGRTHQIRVHMSHAKCPLIGDPLYGQTTQTRLNKLKAAHIVLPEETLHSLLQFHRQALHARELALIHPISGEEMRFLSPIPADLAALESALAGLTIR